MTEAEGRHRARLALSGSLLLLGAAGALGWNAWLARTCPLWVVNHTQEEALVLRGGERLAAVPIGACLPVAVGEGRHALRVERRSGHEELEVELRRGWWERFGDRGLFVLNVARAAALRWEEGVYAGGEGVAPPRPTRVLVGESFQRVEEVDYAFSPLPDVLVGSAPHRERLTSLTAYPAAIMAVLGGFPPDTPREDRLTFLERRLELEPGDVLALDHYVQLAREGGLAARAVGWLRAGLARRPALVHWHRHHQDLARERGEEEALSAEYARLAEAEPGDAGLQYLAGRVEPDPVAAEARYDRALALAPEQGWAWHGKGFLLAARGDMAAARDAVLRATRALPDLIEIGALAHQVRLLAGEAAELRAELLERERRGALGANRVRWLLEACRVAGDEEGARLALGRWQAIVSSHRDPDARNRAAVIDLVGLELEGRWDEVLAAVDGLARPIAREQLRAAALLELGRLAEAEQLIDAGGPLAAGGREALLLALAWELAGDAARAARWREAGTERWGAGLARERLAARALRAADPLPELPRVALAIPDQAALLLALAAACPGRRQELLARAAPLVARGELFPARLLRRAHAALSAR